jgi:hypothetical protein
VEQLHGEEDHVSPSVAMRAQVVNPADIRMRDAFGELHFVFEPGECARIAHHFRADGFQRQPLMQLQVVDFIHVAHAAGRDESHDAKTPREQVAFLDTRRCGWRRPKHEAGHAGIGGHQPLHFAAKLDIAMAGFIEKGPAPVEGKLDGFDKDASNAIVTVGHEVARCERCRGSLLRCSPQFYTPSTPGGAGDRPCLVALDL